MTGQLRKDRPIGPAHQILRLSIGGLLWGSYPVLAKRFDASTAAVRALPDSLRQILLPSSHGELLLTLLPSSHGELLLTLLPVNSARHSCSLNPAPQWLLCSRRRLVF